MSARRRLPAACCAELTAADHGTKRKWSVVFEQILMSDDHTFTADQAAAATTAMRMVLGLPPEQVGVAQFVAMISDEIQKLREAGHSDDDIASIVRESTHSTIEASDIASHYALPEARGWASDHDRR